MCTLQAAGKGCKLPRPAGWHRIARKRVGSDAWRSPSNVQNGLAATALEPEVEGTGGGRRPAGAAALAPHWHRPTLAYPTPTPTPLASLIVCWIENAARHHRETVLIEVGKSKGLWSLSPDKSANPW